MAQNIMITKEELLNKFKTEEKIINVKAWDADVKIRRLTIKESDEAESMMLGSVDLLSAQEIKNGKMTLNADSFSRSQLLTVSCALVEPKMTIDELNGMSGAEARAGVLEIYLAAQDWDKPKKSEDEKPSSK